MNRRHPDLQLEFTSPRRTESCKRRVLTLAAGCALGLLAGLIPVGGSSSASAATLGLELRTSVKLAPPDVTLIKDFVDSQFAKLTGTEIAPANKARESLIAEVQSGAIVTQQPSAAFLDAYAQAINAQLAPAAKSPDLRIRLNVAIVVAKVAMKAENARLSPITQTLLADPNDAVVSWAAKAAGAELYWVLSTLPPNAKSDPLLTALAAAAKRPKVDGSVVQNVYTALNLSAPPNVPANVWAKVLGLVVPEVQGIIRSRLGQYQTGIPNDAAVEKYGMAFICRKDIWGQQAPAQQVVTAQLLVDIVAFAGQRIVAAPQSAQRGLAVAINEAGKNMWVIADATVNPSLKVAVKPIMDVNERVPAATASSSAAANFNAVQKLMAGVKEPVTLPPLPTASTQPTTNSESNDPTTRAS